MTDFYEPLQPMKKVSSQANSKQQNNSNKSFQSYNTSSAPSQDNGWDIPDDLLADADGFAKAEDASTADVLSSQTNKGLEEKERQSRKRDVRDLFGNLSDDSDSELVIDAPMSSEYFVTLVAEMKSGD